MSKIILDTSFISHWKDPQKTQQEERQFSFFEETLEKNKSRIFIPTPVLAELLMGPFKNCIPSLSKNVRILPFDEKAAIECAEIFKDTKQPKSEDSGKAKIKFDCQILSIAKTNDINVIYSDDDQLIKRATKVGVKIIKTTDLEMPPPTLFDNIQD